MSLDITPNDFKIVASKNKLQTDDSSEAVGGTIGGLGTTPVSEVEGGGTETVAAEDITGELQPSQLALASRGWVQNCSFSVASNDEVEWGGGVFRASDGTSYTIAAGTTGDMTAKTYIYLDSTVSTTAYQTSTDLADAVGAGKVLIGVAEDGTDEATFIIFNDKGINIDGSDIVVNSITGNELSASIVYAGTIVIDSNGVIRSGQTAYHTGTGWWIGKDGDTPKLSIGNPAANYITWDGTNLVINGYVQSNKGAFGGDGSDGALTITSGTTTIDCANAAFVSKNYTSISITGTGKLAFSNPHANGTVIVLKSKGDVTLTSSTAPMIDASNMGAAGGGTGTAGNSSNNNVSIGVATGGGGGDGSETVAGGDAPFAGATFTTGMFEITSIIPCLPGSGGGGGSVGTVGGRGGGGLYIECGGALNFTTASGISVAGENGDDVDGRASGGGGGGCCIILYNELTADSGTIVKTGGAGGDGGLTTGAGAGGGASLIADGGAGEDSDDDGGDGGVGFSLVAVNSRRG